MKSPDDCSGDRDHTVRATESLQDGTRWCPVPEAGPIRTPRPVDVLPLVPCRSESVLKIRAAAAAAAAAAVDLMVVNGTWLCYTNQGMAARQRA